MGLHEHRSNSPRQVSIYVVTLSDTRDEMHDASGDAICKALRDAGQAVCGRTILREDAKTLRAGITKLLQREDIDAVVINGGTGIAPRDRAFDILSDLYDRPLPGFGELFRALSYAEIGSAALASRASAGVAHGKLLFSVPGSLGAVRLALDRLIVPELAHLVGELRRAAEPEARP